MMDKQLIFSGSSNPQLAKSVADNLGLKLGEIDLGTFSDGEISIQINENVRGKDAFIIQSTNSPAEKNSHYINYIKDYLRESLIHTQEKIHLNKLNI